MAKITAEPGLAGLNEVAPLSTSAVSSSEQTTEAVGSPRHLTWLLLRKPGSLTADEQSMLAFLREVKDLNTTDELAQQFFKMIRERQADQLDPWLQACEKSNIADLQTFAEGLKRES